MVVTTTPVVSSTASMFLFSAESKTRTRSTSTTLRDSMWRPLWITSMLPGKSSTALIQPRQRPFQFLLDRVMELASKMTTQLWSLEALEENSLATAGTSTQIRTLWSHLKFNLEENASHSLCPLSVMSMMVKFTQSIGKQCRCWDSKTEPGQMSRTLKSEQKWVKKSIEIEDRELEIFLYSPIH